MKISIVLALVLSFALSSQMNAMGPIEEEERSRNSPPRMAFDPSSDSFSFVPSFCSSSNPDCLEIIDSKGVWKKDVSIRSFYDSILSLIAKYGAGNVALIIDLDGTLTNESDPKQGKAEPRGDSVLVLKALAEKGVCFVISSAWHIFDETIWRIRELGLSDIAGIAQKQVRFYPNLSCDPGKKLEVLCQGNVVSCRYFGNQVYWRQKAYALDFVSGNQAPKVVCVLDDANHNLGVAKEDMVYTHWFSSVEEVHLYHLSRINGVSFPADCLDESDASESEDSDESSSGEEIVVGGEVFVTKLHL